MNEKDRFAVWIAEALLSAHDEEFAAMALADLARRAETSGDLDAELTAAAANTRRPGDFGVDFVGPLLPVLLVEFGRMLWDAYVKSLAEQGGETLAKATMGMIQALVRRTWGGSAPALPLPEVEARLRGAAERAGLTAVQTEALVASLRSPEMARAIAEQ